MARTVVGDNMWKRSVLLFGALLVRFGVLHKDCILIVPNPGNRTVPLLDFELNTQQIPHLIDRIKLYRLSYAADVNWNIGYTDKLQYYNTGNLLNNIT